VTASPYANAGAGWSTGAAYAFVPQADGFSEGIELAPDGTSDTPQFGQDVTVGGETLVVGAPLDDVAGTENAGTSSVYDVPDPSDDPPAPGLPEDPCRLLGLDLPDPLCETLQAVEQTGPTNP
jgi:hypothetical protein